MCGLWCIEVSFELGVYWKVYRFPYLADNLNRFPLGQELSFLKYFHRLRSHWNIVTFDKRWTLNTKQVSISGNLNPFWRKANFFYVKIF